MKVETRRIEKEKKFLPTTISITAESEEEFKTIFAIFNYAIIADFLNSYCGRGASCRGASYDIIDSMKKAYGGDIRYQDFHSELHNRISHL